MSNRKVTAELELQGKDATGPMWKSVAMRMGQIEKQMGRFNQTAAAFNSKIQRIDQATKGMDRVSRGVQAHSEMMVGGLKALGTVAAGSYVKDAVMSFADLERRMTRIGITAEASAEETKAALETIKHETKQLGLPLEQGIAAMDTMTAAGMRMGEALAFLPSVLLTTQATGSQAEDIANAGLKVASAFKLEAKDMQKAYDDMAYSAMNGQFELRNMAQYLPRLSTLWASVGYKGEDGLKRLLAMLQTIRAHTGTNEEAATWAENIMLKMTSDKTIKNFEDFDIDLMAELDKAMKRGEDKLHAFLRLSMQAVNGNVEEFNKLFQDTEVQLGMKTLASFPEELAKNIELLNSTQVDGTNMRNLQRVINDTTSSVERFNQSYETFKQKIGGRVAPVATAIMDTVSTGIDVGDAKDAGMKKLGWGFFRRQIGPVTQDEWIDVLHAGGYDTPEFRQARQGKQMRNMVGRGIPTFVPSPEFPGGDHGYTPKSLPLEGPFPGRRDTALRENLADLNKGMMGRGLPSGANGISPAMPDGSINAFAAFEERLKQLDSPTMGKSFLDGVDLEEKSQKAGNTFSNSAGSGLLDRAAEAGSAFGRAAADTFNSAIRSIQTTVIAPNGNAGVNANVGKSSGAATPPKPPAGGGW